jgi:LacI family transcriptional regulator
MAKEPGPTIYSVANEAEVSISTVSRVLNSPSLVKRETRDKVLAAIDRLGYVPDIVAQVRAKKNLCRIGVLTPFFTHPSFVQRMRGISSVLAAESYELVIYPVATMAQVSHYLETLPLTRRLDGLIAMALKVEGMTASRFVKAQFPLVMIEIKDQRFSSVVVDNRAGGLMAADYLVKKGHTVCGFIGDGGLPAYAIQPSQDRYEGFKAGLINAGQSLLDAHVIFPGKESVTSEVKQLLNHPNRPSAIFTSSDELAMQVMSVARRERISIPEELALIGFDDLDFANHIGLTTINQKLDESGRIAALLLLDFLKEKDGTKQRIELELSIVERDTV